MGNEDSKTARPRTVPYGKLLKAQKLHNIDPVHYYNYAIVGSSGTGKSSLINALRGLKANDPMAAKTGVGETTYTITKYDHPVNDFIKIWDVPGASAQTCTAKDYFEHFFLYCFDGVIVVMGDRISEADIAIAKSAVVNGVKCIFVRSKSDGAVANSLRDSGMDDDEDSDEERSNPQQNTDDEDTDTDNRDVEGTRNVMRSLAAVTLNQPTKLSQRQERAARSSMRELVRGLRDTLAKTHEIQSPVYLVSSQMILAVLRPDLNLKLNESVLLFDERKVLKALAKCAEERMDEKDCFYNSLCGSPEERIRQLGRSRPRQ